MPVDNESVNRPKVNRAPIYHDPEDWPLITPDLAGIGGDLKVEPAHFVVEEIPLYAPTGEGEHVYVSVTREGWTTRELQREIADLFDLKNNHLGCAGLKDKHARATQTFSLHLLEADPDEVAEGIQTELGVTVEWATRHANKIRRGHLIGNRFAITLLNPDGPQSALDRAQSIARALRQRGLPNYFGTQRLGEDCENARHGREILLGQREKRGRWIRRFLMSAYQSWLFNRWLAERIRLGWFAEIHIGDVAKKTDTGGLFNVDDLDQERPRFDRDEITYTGPIYGHRLWWARGDPGELEARVVAEEGITDRHWAQAQLKGTRRRARIVPHDLEVEAHPDGLRFSFALPKGAYATTVLREFQRPFDG
ncbi:MAG: tRNA pseudouridine(13) synthase TruD [Candidatus Bipolaricaulia bacterium]